MTRESPRPGSEFEPGEPAFMLRQVPFTFENLPQSRLGRLKIAQ
jgi:hypothetical protein